MAMTCISAGIVPPWPAGLGLGFLALIPMPHHFTPVCQHREEAGPHWCKERGPGEDTAQRPGLLETGWSLIPSGVSGPM